MKLAISIDLINKNELENKAAMAKGFENVDAAPKALAGLINKGFAFCPQVKNGHRKADNFICSDYIAVDIDEDWTVEEALAEDFVKNQASILYTTPSHTPEHHRFRIVFELPRTITDKDEMRHAMAGIGRKFRGDPSTTDAARLFFGSRGSNPMVIGKILEDKYLTEIIELGKEKKNLSDSTVEDKERAGAPRRAGIQSNLTVEPDLLVRNRSGNLLPLSEWPLRTSIFCPFHLDHTPSAFTVRSVSGSVGIRCSTCNRTFWTPNKGRNKYDFYLFDSTIRKLEVEEQVETIPDEDELFESPARRSFITTNEAKLSLIPLEPGLTFVKSPKNTGKTTFLERIVNQCKEQRLSVLLIGHRQSLLQANAKRLGLKCYLDIAMSWDGRRWTYTPGTQLAISVDSLPKYLKPKRHKYKVVLIDESEQVFAHLVSDTLKEKRHHCYALLNHYIATAQTVIALDADMNRITMEAILGCVDKESDKEVRVFLNEYKETGKRLYLYESETHLYSELMLAIREGKRCFICCNSKMRVETIIEKIARDFDQAVSLFWITSDNSTKDEVFHFVQNIKTEILKYQVVIVSPAMGTGVDITFPQEAEHVDCVFGFFSPRINTHYDIDQQLYRVRQPKEIRVWVSPRVFSFETDREALKQELAESGVVPDVIKSYDKDGEPIIEFDDPYLDLYGNIISAQRASKNNLLSNFVELRKRNGWEIINVEKDDKRSKDGKAIKKDARELRIEKRVRDILAVPSIDQDRHQELVRKQDKKVELSREEKLQLEKSWMELFYKEPVTRDLILQDDEGRLRDQVRIIDELLVDSRPAMRKLRAVLNKISIENPTTKAGVIGMVLESAGLYNRKTQSFGIRNVIRAQSLAQFATTCKKEAPLINRVLEIDVRGDVVTKPVYQLNTFLKLIGLTADKVDKKRSGGTAVYEYRIDEAGYRRMAHFVEVRRRKSDNPKRKKKGVTLNG